MSIATRDSAGRNCVVYQKALVVDPFTAVPLSLPVLCTVVVGGRTVMCNRSISDLIAAGDYIRLGR